MSTSPVRAVLLAGPTASGKSQLALVLANELDGVVINADAMQVYREWKILTDQPGEEARARAPHHLYGHIGIDCDYSAGRWLREVETTLREIDDSRRLPIITGGTGLYFRALLHGLAPIPPVPAEIRATVAHQLREDGLEAVAAELMQSDPETADRTDLRNPRRVQRALEVWRTTGTSLATWHQRAPKPLINRAETEALLLQPPAALHQHWMQCRLDAMLEAGVEEEAQSVWKTHPDPGLPGMQALGAQALFALIEGRATFAETYTEILTATRRYAKRQATWFRKHMQDWTVCGDLHFKPIVEQLEARMEVRGQVRFQPRYVTATPR